MPSDFAFKVMNRFHRVALKLTGGKLGYSALSMPVVELTTTGRRTGRQHSVMLTSPLQLDGTYVVVASRGGDGKTPAWCLNLQANPDVEFAVQGGPREPRTARVATPEERAELWPRVTSEHKNYAGYQKKMSSDIPLVLVEPKT